MPDAIWPWVAGAVALGGAAWALTRKKVAAPATCAIDTDRLNAWSIARTTPTLYLPDGSPPPPNGSSLTVNFPDFAAQATPAHPTLVLVLKDGTFWAYSSKLTPGGGHAVDQGQPTIRPDFRQDYCDFKPGAVGSPASLFMV